MCLSPPGAAGASDPSLLSVSLGAAVFSPVLPCVHRPLCALESHQLSAHPLEGGAGEVVEHRVQYAVEEGEGQRGVEDQVYYLHGFTRPLRPNPHPDQHLGHVAGQEADNEHHHHHGQGGQGPPDIVVAIQMPAPELRGDAERADKDQSQGDEEGDNEDRLVPEGRRVKSQTHHEALALHGTSHHQVLWSHQKVDVEGDGERPHHHSDAHSLGDGHRVEAVVGVQHAHILYLSRAMSVRKAMLPPRFRDTQEEEDAAEDVTEPPVQSREVVAGAKRQHHVEEEAGHGQVEEEDGAALPGPHVPAEDPEGKAVAQDAQQELSDNQRRQCSGEQLTLVGTADVH